MEVSAIDMKWGVLFDRDGLPTKRWEQVARGIGSYLVSSSNFMPTEWSGIPETD